MFLVVGLGEQGPGPGMSLESASVIEARPARGVRGSSARGPASSVSPLFILPRPFFVNRVLFFLLAKVIGRLNNAVTCASAPPQSAQKTVQKCGPRAAPYRPRGVCRQVPLQGSGRSRLGYCKGEGPRPELALLPRGPSSVWLQVSPSLYYNGGRGCAGPTRRPGPGMAGQGWAVLGLGP